MPALKFGLSVGGSRELAQGAKEAEELGFDSIWAGEHVVWRTPTHDALMVLAGAATVTKRIRLGTSILLLPLKHPVLVCKAVNTLDHLSGGRASLGIGVGGEYPKEFEAIGIATNQRGARANESIELMKRLWTEDNVTFQGRFFQMTDVTIDPKPAQKPHPPILVGGRRGALSRTAKYADGWMPYMYSVDMYREDWKKIEVMAGEHGRNPADIERTLFAFITIDDTYEAAAAVWAEALGGRYAQDFDSLVQRYAIAGTPEQCAERLEQFREAGVEHFILAPSGPREQTAAFPDIIANAIIPMLRR